jgi:hypothetical protein
MLQDYRYARPHDAAECPVCAPSGPGHPLCQAPGCQNVAEFQVPRHATQAEYDALPEERKPIDGLAHQSVFACDDDAHAEATAAFCTHPEPKSPTCPTCNAAVDAPCVKADGTERTVHHAARSKKPGVYDVCLHAHREDCQVFTGCQCTGDDAAPARIPRTVAPPDHADGSRSKLPAEIVKTLAEAWDVPWWTVQTYWTGLTQDNLPMVTVEYWQLDADGNIDHDEHGAEIPLSKVIALDGTLPPALAGP